MADRLQEFPYERDAMAGKEMPDGLEIPDALMYIGLRMLYHQFKSGAIDREIATAEKRKLIKKYKYQQFIQEASNRYVRLIKETELARAHYRKQRTIEAADALVNAVECVLK